MSDDNLSGDELTRFPELDDNAETLDLSFNRIRVIPESIGRLINLEALELENNQIEVIPDIGGLTNLLVLNVVNNPIITVSISIDILNLQRFLVSNFTLIPLQDSYHFTNIRVLEVVRRSFDLIRYNELMERIIKNENWNQRRPMALVREGHMIRPRANSIRTSMGSRVALTRRLTLPILKFLGDRYTRKTIDDVLPFPPTGGKIRSKKQKR